MHNRTTRVAARLAFILCLAIPFGLLRAQNENETTGFQSNHVFESGHFGENIDVLNGGLHLTLPIGPTYQVNDRLSYQLVLNYNSKVWDYSDYRANDQASVRPYNEGPVGLGFTLNFGRLLQDVQTRTCTSNVDCYMTTWQWVTSDGNRHDLWIKEAAISTDQPSAYPLVAGDLSYVKIFTPPGVGCLATEDPGCFTVSTPDGLTYTLGRHVAYAVDANNTYRQDTQSFGGWYVTRIEDRTIPQVGGVYPMRVSIEYDTRLGFEHVIKKITDGRGDVNVVFANMPPA